MPTCISLAVLLVDRSTEKFAKIFSFNICKAIRNFVIFARLNEKRAKVKKETTKEQIVAGAKVLFHRFGFEKTSMEDIANHVHKAKRSLYNHFTNKEELFAEAVSVELMQIRERLFDIFEDTSKSVLERLRDYLQSRAELMSKATTYHQLLRRTLDNQDRRFAEARGAEEAFDRWEHALFERVWKAKPCAPDETISESDTAAFADMLQMALRGLNYTFFVQDNYERYKNNYNFLIDLIINSIRYNSVQLIKK